MWGVWRGGEGPPTKDVDRKSKWATLAEKELRGRPLSDLTWDTLEGIAVQPVYVPEDVVGLDHLNEIPGEAPFTPF